MENLITSFSLFRDMQVYGAILAGIISIIIIFTLLNEKYLTSSILSFVVILAIIPIIISSLILQEPVKLIFWVVMALVYSWVTINSYKLHRSHNTFQKKLDRSIKKYKVKHEKYEKGID